MKTGSLKLTKQDSVTGHPLEGCGFKVYDADKKLLVTGFTDANGEVSFDNLPYGDYYYQEFQAPDGYYNDDDSLKLFSIVDDGAVIETVVTDTPKDETPPRTDFDDGSWDKSYIILLTLIIGSGAAVLLAALRKKKQE
ncbi:MAG: prealbumin-like fold domain-containing protein [Oscillospiraceae bacterium]